MRICRFVKSNFVSLVTLFVVGACGGGSAGPDNPSGAADLSQLKTQVGEYQTRMAKISELSAKSASDARALKDIIDRGIGGGSDLDRMIGDMDQIGELAKYTAYPQNDRTQLEALIQELKTRMSKIAPLAGESERDATNIKGIINRYIGGGSDFDPIIDNMKQVQELTAG